MAIRPGARKARRGRSGGAPDGKEVAFIGTNDPRTPVGRGRLRASQRKTVPQRSLPYRPWHTHDEVRPLAPGEPVELDVEIWPTCIVVPPGYRIGLTVRGKDYEYDGTGAALPYAPYPMKGSARSPTPIRATARRPPECAAPSSAAAIRNPSHQRRKTQRPRSVGCALRSGRADRPFRFAKPGRQNGCCDRSLRRQ